mmetsp:Transcript_74435/g.168619  ORF Transcript_74435/g.168619 Transcript_74435/m.168619 type:complete len:408 (-) Transcript_74435:104-1327(-)
MAAPAQGASYPRDVPADLGMPEGWKGVEKLYGPTSKYAGKVYSRYFSLDGVHRNICSAKQAIQLHYEGLGQDPAPKIAEYHRLQKERKDSEAEERKFEREAKGKLAGEQREVAIQRFRSRFGALTGPLVYCFPGWTTRWHYQPNCDQVMVEYLDTEGNSWKLLKDLECSFQHKIDTGVGAHIPQLIETAQVAMDTVEFAQGSKKARETGGVYEITPGEGTTRMLTQNDRLDLRAEREATREHPAKKRRGTPLVLSPDGPKQEGWAALESREDVKQAFKEFRALLEKRGFQSSVGLLAVHGVPSERKFSKRIRGVYFQIPSSVEGQKCYQKLLHFPQVSAKVGCDGIYIVWSKQRSRWEVSTDLAEGRPVVAHVEGSEESVVKAQGPWKVQDGQADFTDEPGFAIVEP